MTTSGKGIGLRLGPLPDNVGPMVAGAALVACLWLVGVEDWVVVKVIPFAIVTGIYAEWRIRRDRKTRGDRLG